jgi:protein-S-isoprenylcysteine O-methyltransferase Ste14
LEFVAVLKDSLDRITSQWMAWSSMPIPAWMRWLGLAVVGCSGSLVLWTFRNLGKNLTDTVVIRRDHTLVTSGPYHYVRHPFYVAFALGALGESLAMANWFLLLSGCLPMAFLVARTRIEEENLIERFSDDYRRYMQTTGRFFPKLRRSSRLS